MEYCVQSKENLLPGGRLDQPIIEVTTMTNAGSVKKNRNRNYEPQKDMQSHEEPNAKKLELVHLPKRYKPEELATSRMQRNLQVASFESRDTIQSPLHTERRTDWRVSILKEIFRTFISVTRGWLPASTALRTSSPQTVGCNSPEKEEEPTLLALSLTVKEPPLPRLCPEWMWGCTKEKEWGPWKRRGPTKGNAISQPQDHHYPRIRAPVAPHLPWSDSQPPTATGQKRRLTSHLLTAKWSFQAVVDQRYPVPRAINTSHD